MLIWKLRITVLWIAMAICQSAAMALLMFEPGAIRDMIAGELHGVNLHSAEVQINTALYWLVPMAMAYLTLVLKDAANRWINGLAGASGALNGIVALANYQAGTSAGVKFVGIVATLVPLLIVWHAWKWPRPTQLTPPRQTQETTLR